MKTMVLERGEALQHAADEIAAVVTKKPGAVIAMAAGRTMLPLWKLLEEAVQAGKLSLKDITMFQVTDFLHVPEEKSLRRMTEDYLIDRTDLQSERCFWLSEENVLNYEAWIQNAGGLDLAVLGLGDNAHIGLNEPATQYDSRCHIQKLTDKTKRQYCWLFGNEENAPEKAATMGIRTLTEARKLMLLTFGEEKAQATFDMLYARDDSVIPAAFLQLPYDVTVYADEEAGKKL